MAKYTCIKYKFVSIIIIRNEIKLKNLLLKIVAVLFKVR